MVKQLQTKLMLLLCMLVAGVSSAYGADVTITKTINELVETNNWNVSSGNDMNGLYTSFTLDENITISTAGSANCGSIWGTTTYDWRLYQNQNGDVTVTATTGCELKSVTFTYNVSNTGTLKNGNTIVSSNSSTSISGNSVTFTVGNTNNKTNGQVRITAISVTYTPAVSYAISAHSNDDSWGTVSLTSKVITATPAVGHRVSKTTPYTVTPEGSATVTQSGNTFAVNPSADCTVTINFEAIPTHTISWSVNGIVTTETVYEDAAITFSAPTTNIPSGYSFKGWYGSELSPQNTAPTYVTSATCTNDQTYYAVFAKTTESEAWKNVNISNVSSEGAGIYIIITADGHAFNGEISSGHGQVTTDAFSFTSNIASVAPAGACELTLSASGSGFKMYNKDNGFLYATKAGSGGLAWHDSENSYWSYASSNWTYNSNSAYLRNYQNTTIRTYGANNGTSTIQFAKKITVSTDADFRTSVASTATISINAACNDGDGAYYGTFYTDKAYVMHEYLEGKIVSVDKNGKMSIDAVYNGGDVVPANTGLLIMALEPGDYQVNLTDETGDDWSEFNMLKGTLTADEMTVGDDCLFYRLTMHDGTKIGFWWGADNGGSFKPGANKAYLAVPNSVQGARISGFSFDADNTTTAIENVSRKSATSDRCYNLNGQRVDASMKGIVIVNGKKMINK